MALGDLDIARLGFGPLGAAADHAAVFATLGPAMAAKATRNPSCHSVDAAF